MADNVFSLVEMLDGVASAYAKKVCLIFGSKRITYQELLAISKRLAYSLYELGIRDADKVGIWLPNCPEFVYSFFAILKLGAVVVPVNTMFKEEEAKVIIQDSRAKVIISSADKIPQCESILSRLDTLKYVISLTSSLHKAPLLSFYRLIEEAGEFQEKRKIEEDALAEIIYTSGTTGRPKGACLTHKNILANIRDCSFAIRVTSRDCFICILPLFHSFASTVCMLLPLYKGARVVIMRTLKPFKRVIRAVLKNRVTVFTGVPSIYSILSEVKITPLRAFLSVFFNPLRLCISGAAALPGEVGRKFERRFRRPLLQGYGLTEAAPVVSLNPLRGKRKIQSVGRSLPSLKVKVLGQEGGELLPGETGELLVKGPNVMRGYYNLEEETALALKDGWLYTGDLAKIDKDGFIFIMGRLKEMINVRGLNVYPREIENLLYKYPAVKEAAVVGVTHRHRGEAPVAFIVKKENLKERELLHYLRKNLASYKVPLKIFFKDNLPKNTTGKILKAELQREVKDIFCR